MIRRFREETNLRAHILLDVSESLRFREDGLMPKIDYACHLAAGLMFILVGQGDSSGLATFVQGIERRLDPVASFEGLREPLLFLESIDPHGRSDIEAALHDAAASISRKNLVIVISDLLQAPERILRGVAHLRHDGHEVLVIHVLDPAERRLPYAGLIEFRELETGERMVVEADEVRASYEREVEHYIAELRAGCAQFSALYHMVDTRTPIDDVLFTRLTRS